MYSLCGYFSFNLLSLCPPLQCPGCPYGGLDLSRGLFQHFASEDVGIVYGEWEFTDSSANGGAAASTAKAASTSTTTVRVGSPTGASRTESPGVSTTATTGNFDSGESSNSTGSASHSTRSNTHSNTHQHQTSSSSLSSTSSPRLATQHFQRVNSSAIPSSTPSAAEASASGASTTSSVAIPGSTPSEQQKYDENVKLLGEAIHQMGSMFEKLFGASTSAPTATA